MTLTLTANINASVRLLHVTGTVSADIEPTYRFRLDDELLELQAFVPMSGINRPSNPDRNRWYVRRGLDLTEAASHTAGATIKGAADAFVSGTDQDAPDPFSSGGGGGSGLTNPLTEDLDADGHAITGLADPTNAQDAATKQYVLDNAGGGAVLTAYLRLSPSDITQPPFTPFTLLDGIPGVVFVVVGGVVNYVGGTTAYTGDGIADTDMALTYGDPNSGTSQNSYSTGSLDFWGDVEPKAAMMFPGFFASSLPLDTVAGSPLVLNLVGAGLADGDSPVDIWVKYCAQSMTP